MLRALASVGEPKAGLEPATSTMRAGLYQLSYIGTTLAARSNEGLT